jgi:putative PIN family toxin of toxin-antitoxin system
MKVMPDTNTIVSGIVFPGPERHLLHAIFTKEHTLVLSEYVFQETTRVLTRKFPGEKIALENWLQLSKVERVPLPQAELVKEVQSLIRDPKDAAILATVICAKPDIFITGDRDFFTPEITAKIKVLTTKDALLVL